MNNSDPTVGIDTVAVPAPLTVTFLKKKVMLALPWGKMTHPITSFCVAQLMDRRRTTTALNFGDAFVAHSRNSIVDLFLKSDCEHLLQIDDDMVVPFGHAEWFKAHTRWKNYPEPFASLNAIDRLLSHGKTIVGAVYKGRYAEGNFVYGEGPQPKQREFVEKGPRDEIHETRWVGTGCLMVHRSVFEDIEKRYPLLARGADRKGGQWFSSSEHALADSVDRVIKALGTGAMTGDKAMQAYQVLVSAAADAKRNSTLGMGEDVQFMTRAKQAGHTAYVDFGLRVGHIGHFVY